MGSPARPGCALAGAVMSRVTQALGPANHRLTLTGVVSGNPAHAVLDQGFSYQ
jgi:hypothetical protein